MTPSHSDIARQARARENRRERQRRRIGAATLCLPESCRAEGCCPQRDLGARGCIPTQLPGTLPGNGVEPEAPAGRSLTWAALAAGERGAPNTTIAPSAATPTQGAKPPPPRHPTPHPPAPPDPPRRPGRERAACGGARDGTRTDCAVGSGEWAEPPHSPWTLRRRVRKSALFWAFSGSRGQCQKHPFWGPGGPLFGPYAPPRLGEARSDLHRAHPWQRSGPVMAGAGWIAPGRILSDPELRQGLMTNASGSRSLLPVSARGWRPARSRAVLDRVVQRRRHHGLEQGTS